MIRLRRHARGPTGGVAWTLQTQRILWTCFGSTGRLPGLTQEALAERAGISARTIRLLEQDGSTPQRATAQRLAAALGLAGEEVEQFLAAATTSPSAPIRPRSRTRSACLAVAAYGSRGP